MAECADFSTQIWQRRTVPGKDHALLPGPAFHFPDCGYIAAMLATPEIIREAGQFNQLAALLPRWREVPLYREAFVRADCQGVDLDCFRRLPLLDKRGMRENFPRNFLSNGNALDSLLEKKLIELEHTSGTLGERLPVIFGRGWWDQQEERALRLNDFVARVLDEFPDARRATLVPPACNGLTCPTVWASREQRTVGNTLFINLARIPFVLDDAELARMAADVSAWSPQFLDLDPVHGAWFALFCERKGIRFPSLKFVLCSYEFASVMHRKILARVFGVPVFSLYGSTETGHLLMENERGEMKTGYDTAFLEVSDAGPDGICHLLVTTLTNEYMPLLRYRIGDLVEKQTLPYGNRFVVHGRAADALMAGDGRRVTVRQVDECFSEAGVIAHYELRQNERGDYGLRFVPYGTGPTEPELRRAASRLEALLSVRTAIKTEALTVLVPQASGKFRLTCAAPVKS
jgi:phenylacetate-CoA ligase